MESREEVFYIGDFEIRIVPNKKSLMELAQDSKLDLPEHMWDKLEFMSFREKHDYWEHEEDILRAKFFREFLEACVL